MARLLEVRRLSVHYPLPGAWPWQAPARMRALHEIHFNLDEGEVLGVAGESGCGKSTLARALIGLQAISSGAISYRGQELSRLDEAAWRPLRREIQMVFQDPLASLNPRMRIGQIVAEPLRSLRPELDGAERERRALEMLERVGLSAALADRYPHEFSGGQCQRVGIARALVVEPRLLICDEPVSALDVSVQAQIINLLRELQAERGLSLLFIAHDLAVVRHIASRVLVMYAGRIMEQGGSEDLFSAPAHPYTRALLACVPGSQQNRHEALLDGELPSARHPPPGCAFATRCPMADEQCTRRPPPARKLLRGGLAACHYAPGAA